LACVESGKSSSARLAAEAGTPEIGATLSSSSSSSSEEASPDVDLFGSVTTGAAAPVFLTGGGRGFELGLDETELLSTGGGKEFRGTGGGSSAIDPRAGKGGGADSLPTVRVRLREGSFGGTVTSTADTDALGGRFAGTGGGSVGFLAGSRGGLDGISSRTAIPDDLLAKTGFEALDMGGGLFGPSSASRLAGSSCILRWPREGDGEVGRVIGKALASEVELAVGFSTAGADELSLDDSEPLKRDRSDATLGAGLGPSSALRKVGLGAGAGGAGRLVGLGDVGADAETMTGAGATVGKDVTGRRREGVLEGDEDLEDEGFGSPGSGGRLAGSED
jgi:hypothetical protein